MTDNKKTLEELVVEFDNHELANEYAFSDLENRIDETEGQVTDLESRLDDAEYRLDQTDYDDLESRLTDTESRLAGLADQLGDLEPMDLNVYLDTLFDKQRESEQFINDLLVKVSELEHRLARTEQSLVARIFRKGVK